MLLAITETSTWGWGSPKTLGLLALGMVLIAAWVREELRSREPLVDMRMMAIRGVWTTNTVAFLIGVGMYSSFVLLPELVQEPASTGYGFGASVTAAGLFLLPATIAIVVVGQMAGVLERRIGSRGSLIGGALFALACYVLLVADRSQEWEIYVAAGLLGIGIGLSFSAMANLIVQNVRQEQTGRGHRDERRNPHAGRRLRRATGRDAPGEQPRRRRHPHLLRVHAVLPDVPDRPGGCARLRGGGAEAKRQRPGARGRTAAARPPGEPERTAA